MLEKLILKNFQPHRKLVVEFDPRVTCIVGPTDTGKSSVIRALRWLCLNRTGSKRLVSWWAKSTTVTLRVDGHVIKRSRGKYNLYKLDGQGFQAFGTSVPEPIADLLNISEENFQRQIDPPLWLASSPAQVGRELNKIVNLDVIDQSLSNVVRTKREAQAKVKSLKELRQKVRHEAEQLDWIADCRRDLQRLEKLEVRQEELRLDIALLSSLLEKATTHRRTGEQAKECLTEGRTAVELGERAEQARDRVEGLDELINQITTTSNRVADYKGRLEVVERKLKRVKECPVCRRPM